MVKMFFRRLAISMAMCGLFFGATTNASAGLIGQNVFGLLNFNPSTTNLFDPANVSLPQGALNETSNPVIISATPSSALEFAHAINGINGVFANFTDNALFITNDVVVAPSATPWTMSFTSSAFVGLLLTEISDTFINGGVTGTLVGDTITFNWAGTTSTGFYQAGYSLLAASDPSSALPEPSVLLLFMLALAGIGLTRYGRSTRSKDSNNTDTHGDF